MVLFNRRFCLVLLGFLLGDFGVKKKNQIEFKAEESYWVVIKKYSLFSLVQ